MLLVIAALFHGKVGGAGERLAVFMITKAGASEAPQGWSGHAHQGHKAAENLVRTQCVNNFPTYFSAVKKHVVLVASRYTEGHSTSYNVTSNSTQQVLHVSAGTKYQLVKKSLHKKWGGHAPLGRYGSITLVKY